MTGYLRVAARWAASILLAAGLAACGGGGGGSGENSNALSGAGAAADARNGDYILYATDAQQYTLTLDFDAKSWRVRGSGVDTAGTFSANGSGFVFDGAAAAVNNARFAVTTDAVAGAVRLPSGLKAFLAARSFVTDPAEAAGVYNFLGTTVDPPAAPNNHIFTGEILASGTFRYCWHLTIYHIADCPAASVQPGALSLSGTEFTAATADGNIRFRVARSGSLRVFLRASQAAGTSRRLWIGLPETGAQPAGTFTGVANSDDSVVTTLAAGYDAALTAASGTTRTRTGTINVLNPTTRGLVGINAGADGNFFAMQNGPLLVLAASLNSVTAPGYFEFGVR